jgi:hypothetical protein
MDRFFGGVGLQRGRRHPSRLQVGDALDFWRVLNVAPPRRLLLVAEMKMPGEALLEFEIIPVGTTHAELRILSRFLPKGLWGIIYWYLLYPFHHFIFSGMLIAMAKAIGKPIQHRPRSYTQRRRSSRNKS